MSAARSRLSSQLERRILRARKTGRVREFELMLALRPQRPAVVAEGDSWFAWPPPNLVAGDNRSNIVHWLARSLDLNLLQLASNGDEAVHMLSGPSRQRLVDVLARLPVDVLLFSGGGNDIVGPRDLDLLLQRPPSVPRPRAADWLHSDRLERRLQAIELAYRSLLDYCDDFSRNPAIRVVTHCYDYALPSPRGARFLGGLVRPAGGRSWIYPPLVRVGVPEHLHAELVRHLIDALAGRLLALESQRPDRLQVVDTRGLLEPEDWLNEIHPNRQGFGKIAARIASEVAAFDHQ